MLPPAPELPAPFDPPDASGLAVPDPPELEPAPEPPELDDAPSIPDDEAPDEPPPDELAPDPVDAADDEPALPELLPPGVVLPVPAEGPDPLEQAAPQRATAPRIIDTPGTIPALPRRPIRRMGGHSQNMGTHASAKGTLRRIRHEQKRTLPS